MSIERITIFCFAASYGVALAMELLHLLRPRLVHRLVAIGFGAAGLLAQTLFLAVQRPPLITRQGSLLFLSWIIAVFYLYGSIHHRRQAWGLFVLPLVLGLIGLADLFPVGGPFADDLWFFRLFSFEADGFWGALHGTLLLLAGVGVCVGFIASVMYLAQLRRLQTKTPPQQGLRLLSLEYLEQMNRWAIIASFPLLTAGMLVGLALKTSFLFKVQGWADPRVLGALALWVDFVILLYLRYSRQVRGRRAALLTILAFMMLLVTLAVPHSLSGGGLP